LKSSIIYSYQNRLLFGYFIQYSSFSIFGWAYFTIFPVIAKDILLVDASGLGMMYTAVGVGAIISGLWCASSYMPFNSGARLLYGAIIYSLALSSFAFTASLWPALVLLSVAGFGQIMQNSTLQTRIQLLAPEEMRGRISSIQSFLTEGARAIGCFGIGFAIEYTSVAAALLTCAFFVAFTALAVRQRYLLPSELAAAPLK
jgi:predicted MFS family arabinose efflux permease